MAELALLVSCEHAVNHVPARFRTLFEDQESLLDSHRGYDRGAQLLATELARHFGGTPVSSRVTRLLIDHNRSPDNRSLWSCFSRTLDSSEKKFLIDEFYLPFRAAVAGQIADVVGQGKTLLHLSVHSFTPELDGKVRRTQLGLLYDPRRSREKKFALRWQQQMQQLDPGLRVHCNAPYRGSSDCHQRTYRQIYPESQYLALELEVNQALVAAGAGRWQQVRQLILRSVQAVVGGEELSIFQTSGRS